MAHPQRFAELWRGEMLESTHSGHAVICDGTGQIVHAWGDPNAVIFPRSSSKMIQALPLITSGAADAHGLTEKQLAFACASHQGAAIHSDAARAWLSDLGLSDVDLRCGPEEPRDIPARDDLIKSDETPCQYHNNCSGKHCGFLTLSQHMRAGPEYIDPAHPVQIAVKDAFEDVTAETSPGYGIDGCSAPNYATTIHGLARAMGFFATAHNRNDSQSKAAARLTQAMHQFPEMVAGETRACTELMRATRVPVALKTGAEAVFVAILPTLGLGVALKVMDGGTRGAESAIAQILVSLDVLDANHPDTRKRLNAPQLNRNSMEAAYLRPTKALDFTL